MLYEVITVNILQMLELIVMPEWWIIVLLALVYGAGVMVRNNFV